MINIQKAKRFRHLLINSFRAAILQFQRDAHSHTYVFHHLPRCGGTSLRSSISEQLKLFNDYRMGWTKYYPLKVPLNKINENQCLVGHFETNGYRIFERYPEILSDSRFILFTFIRHPLDLKVSLYFYRDKMEQIVPKKLVDFLFEGNNYLSYILGVNCEDYIEKLDRYNFIGVFEKYDESLRKLGKLIGSENLKNFVVNDAKKDSRLEDITEEDLLEFKRNNELDYKIYEYCLKRFKENE